MNRPFYSDYVRHALRFYARNLSQPRFRSEADKNNWFACQKALSGYTDRDKDILIAVYGGYDTLSDNVLFEAAKKHKIDQSIVWDMMKEFERKVAKRRGLM